MDLSKLSELKRLLQQHGLWARHSLGQNFLVDRQSLQKIVAAAELTAADQVLEIGPGPGVLSRELVKQASKVLALELDRAFEPVLRQIQKEFPNFQYELGNALQYEPKMTDYKLVANIPYYLTAKLIRHFLEEVKYKPKTIVLLVQKEVAEKILEEKSNLLALSVRVYAEAEQIGIVPAESFYPAPKVDSAILRLKLYSEPHLKSDPKQFFKIVRAAFLGKRKQLKNTVSNLGFPTEKIQQILVELGYTEKARPEELNLADWDTLVGKLG